jgi:C-terminal peptidase prc
MAMSKFAGLLGSLVLLAAAWPARAADAPPQQYAVLVGISNYADRQILPRPHAEDDVKALYDLFTNKDYLGIDPGNVRLLLGAEDAQRKSEPATHAKILEALKWAVSKARPDDLVIFAFVGEGAPNGEKNCYFATDSTFTGRAKDAVTASEIEQALTKLKSRQFCAFIDVNFTGFDSGKEKAPEVNPLALFREWIGKEEAADALASRVIFLANNGLKPSLDLGEHGVFTQVVLDGLKGKADGVPTPDPAAGRRRDSKEDKDAFEPDGRITVEELAQYVRKEVPALVKKNAKTEEQKKQRPAVIELQTGDFTLTHNPEVMPTVKKRLAKIAELAQSGAISQEVANQGKDLLTRMPRLKAQRDLRKAFQKLADGELQPDDFLDQRSKIVAKTRLEPDEARDFAATIIKATRVIKAGYVKDVNQGQLVEWAVRGLFRRLGEKVPAEFKDKLAQAKTLREGELRQILTDVRQYLGKREDLAKGKDVTYTLNPMLGHLDKHTDYISPEILEQMKIDVSGEYYGIGAHIRMNPTKEMLQIVTPIMGSPAFRAPLYAGDIVTTIIREVDSDGRKLPKAETYSTKGMPTDEAVKLIKGKAGTKVKLVVEREGADKPLEFELTRARVEMETVMGFKRNKDHRWNYTIDPESKIAYIRLSQFSRNTFRDLQAVVKKLDRQGIGGLVLDLRFNPGGLLDSAVKVSDLFIDDGLIVTIKPRRGQETVYMGKHDGSYLKFPMVCLVNDSSASGSEIVAACLQDHNRAVVMGERTYGKGSVQNIQEFSPTGGQIKLTTASYWRPSGKNINKPSTQGRDNDEWGVTPDVGYLHKLSVRDQDAIFEFQREQEMIRSPDAKRPKVDSKDRQLDMALKYLRDQIKIKTAGDPNRLKKAG